jgi:exonuclease III
MQKHKPKPDVVSILHHNVQSINNKLLELNVLLQSELADVDVLCLSEHWLREEHIKLISTDKYKLPSNFSRRKSDHGGSCIYVKHPVQTKEINYLQGISREKDFEITAMEILDYKMIIVCVCVCVCVCRSPDGDFSTFLKSLQSVIQNVQARNKWLILCGDWNTNFMQESVRLHDMHELLLLHNLVNTVRSPTRVIKDTVSLTDVIIKNKDGIGESSTVMDLGYSDHKAQILQLNVKTIVRQCKKIKSRQYSEKSMQKFKCLLNKESWQEEFQTSEVNSTLQVFMDIFGYYFNITFPNQLINLNKTYTSKWITKGIKISSKRIHFLNSVKRKFSLSREAQAYIKKYNITYKKVLKEVKKK